MFMPRPGRRVASVKWGFVVSVDGGSVRFTVGSPPILIEAPELVCENAHGAARVAIANAHGNARSCNVFIEGMEASSILEMHTEKRKPCFGVARRNMSIPL